MTTGGVAEIEDLLDSSLLEIIRDRLKLTSKPTKNQIRRYFQERLAGDQIEPLSAAFSTKAERLLGVLQERLSS